MNSISYFKNFNMGKELEICGEFIYESAREMYALRNLYARMLGLTIEKDDPNWTVEQNTQLNQISLLDSEANPKPLKKVPYKIHCNFQCDNPSCKGHRLLLTSWEYNWTFLKLLDEKHQDAQAAITELNKRWMENFSNTRLGYLMLGTVNSQDRFHTFIVIGHCSFIKRDIEKGEQTSLF